MPQSVLLHLLHLHPIYSFNAFEIVIAVIKEKLYLCSQIHMHPREGGEGYVLILDPHISQGCLSCIAHTGGSIV